MRLSSLFRSLTLLCLTAPHLAGSALAETDAEDKAFGREIRPVEKTGCKEYWSIGLDPAKFGTHSLRRTKAVLIYRLIGNLRAVQLLLGHSKIEGTVRLDRPGARAMHAALQARDEACGRQSGGRAALSFRRSRRLRSSRQSTCQRAHRVARNACGAQKV